MVPAVSGGAPASWVPLVIPGTFRSVIRFSTSMRASVAGRGAVDGVVTMSGLDVAWTGGEEDDTTLGPLCEHPESPNAATAMAALSATDGCRCIQVGRATRPTLRSGQRA